MEPQRRNEKHRAQWRMTLTKYCLPLHDKRVSQVSTDNVLAVLGPIWTEKRETVSRLRGRIERILDFAKAHGWRYGENPALWRGHLKNLLPAAPQLSRGLMLQCLIRMFLASPPNYAPPMQCRPMHLGF